MLRVPVTTMNALLLKAATLLCMCVGLSVRIDWDDKYEDYDWKM